MKIETENYKGFDIEVQFNKETKNFSASTSVGYSNDETYEVAVGSVRHQIDEFLKENPSNYDELKELIEDKVMVWTGYEDCHIDKKALKVAIENFMKTQE